MFVLPPVLGQHGVGGTRVERRFNESLLLTARGLAVNVEHSLIELGVC